ncbi:Hypothetical predicted protein [Podarcis lilfordi]|uniref:Uncharacterized protein n=1 Tax=Podarcis lilfordi TaxID=74358 RepID=A0AA35KQP2_9SAUR|nr:Hypothetical predicted protein [Podarcis lilfordi]
MPALESHVMTWDLPEEKLHFNSIGKTNHWLTLEKSTWPHFVLVVLLSLAADKAGLYKPRCERPVAR